MRASLPAALIALFLGTLSLDSLAASRPNIVWLVNEDHGPEVGAYGDKYATTPTFDALAAKGLRYARCWSNAPVCAPARSTLICGMYASSVGAEHMRSMVPMPRGTQMYPQLMREAGYYCTNNAKEDYNLTKRGRVWDESSRKAHWRNRAPDQPFLAVFNSEKSHESQIRKRPHTPVHDPAKVRVPAYHPDTPEVRQDWAQYYDGVSAADADAGKRLRELEDAGLTEETIIFYFGDHGSGMPGSKRSALNRGLHVPLIVYIPEKYAHLRPADYRRGGVSERLVSFVDFAPTLLSLAGVKAPEWMQGHAFLGEHAAPPHPFIYGFRGRMDERSDCVRSATDGRHVYVRNFRPDKVSGQHLNYMWQTPTTRVWEQMFKAGELNDAQAAFWKMKPPEELYDLQHDRDEVHNLADAPEHRETLEKLRGALREHQAAIRDVGLMPEGEMHRRSSGTTPYDLARESGFPFSRIYDTAALASSLREDAAPALRAALRDPEAVVRYWAVLGLGMRAADAKEASTKLGELLNDTSPDVRVAAAEIAAMHAAPETRERALTLLGEHADWSKHDVFTVMAALNAIDALGDRAEPLSSVVKTLPAQGPVPDARFKEYVPRKLERLRERFR